MGLWEWAHCLKNIFVPYECTPKSIHLEKGLLIIKWTKFQACGFQSASPTSHMSASSTDQIQVTMVAGAEALGGTQQGLFMKTNLALANNTFPPTVETTAQCSIWKYPPKLRRPLGGRWITWDPFHPGVSNSLCTSNCELTHTYTHVLHIRTSFTFSPSSLLPPFQEGLAMVNFTV